MAAESHGSASPGLSVRDLFGGADIDLGSEVPSASLVDSNAEERRDVVVSDSFAYSSVNFDHAVGAAWN